MAGTREGQAALLDYLRTGGVNIDPTTRAWCADFVNATLAKAGQKGTDSGLARSFLKWGMEVTDPQVGDIAVFSRGDPNGPYGHVGFFAGYNPDGTIRVLGGNQSDSVSYANYPADRLLGFRRAAPDSGEAPQTQVASAPSPQSTETAPFGSIAPSPIPKEVAQFAAAEDPKPLGQRLTEMVRAWEAQIPQAPRPGPMGDARSTGNALLKFMQSPTAADMFIQKRLAGIA